MKTIQKLTLGLLTVAGLSTSASAASVTYNFDDGAALSGGIIGNPYLVGSSVVADLAFSSAVTGDAHVTKGRINLAAAPNVTNYMYLEGAVANDSSVLLTANVASLNKLNVAQSAGLDISTFNTELEGLGGTAGKALAISGSGALTLGDLSGHGGYISACAPTATVDGGSKFPAQSSTFARVALTAAPATPAPADLRIGILDVSIAVTTANFISSGTLYAQTINLAGNSFAENVTAY